MRSRGTNPSGDGEDIESGEAERLRREQQSHVLIDALPAAVYATDAEGLITFYNKAATHLWGRTPRLGEDRWSGAWRLYWPDGRSMGHDESPMAMALKTGKSVRGIEAVAERPDGTRVPFVPYPTPLFDSEGNLVGAVNMLLDISERRTTELASQQLAAIVESSYDAIISKDLRGVVESWNKAAEIMFGYRAEEIIGRSILTIIPQDRHSDEELIIGKIGQGERIEHYETVRRKKDGTLIDVSITVSPLFDPWGKVVGASKIARDITERKRGEEQRNMLLGEMKHRTRNFQTLLDAIARQSTPRDKPEIAAAIGALVARLKALLLTGELVVDSETRSVSMRTLFDAALSAFRASHSAIRIDGPDIEVPEVTAGRLALAMHELATNAVKHGALKDTAGHVDLVWHADGDHVAIAWKETSPTFSQQPTNHRGFGTSVIRSAVQHEKDSSVKMDFEPDGLRCRFEFSLTQ